MKNTITIISLLALSINVAAENRNVKAYFNHFEGASYTDPYRNIKRPGHNLENVVIRNIKKAKKSIYVAVQEIRLPLIAQALVKKAKEGVDVRVVLENTYNHTANNESPWADPENSLSEHETMRSVDLRAFIDIDKDGVISSYEMSKRDAVYILRKAKIKIKDDTSDLSHGSGLMHHKFIVVDNMHVVVSSANMTLSGIHGDFTNPKSRGNANSLVQVKSRNLAQYFTREFLYMWGGKTGKDKTRFGLSKPHRGLEKTTVLGDEVSVQFSPISKNLPWGESVNGLISREIGKSSKSARAGLFVFSDQRIADAFEQKVSDIHKYQLGLLVERKFAYRPYSELLDIWGISIRNESCEFEVGNNPWRYPVYDVGTSVLTSGDLLHHKFVVLDEETVIVGSQNWSDSANHINDENVLLIRNKKVAELFTKEYMRLNRTSQKGPPRSLIIRASEQNRRCVLSDLN